MEDSTMLLPNHEAVEFLLSRRSRPAKTLLGPGPTDKELKTLLTAAARTPDHGKLEPWRFIVFQRDAFSRLVNLIVKRGNELELEPEKINKTCVALKTGAVMIAVVYSPKQSKKIPEIEQILSAGAVCLSLLNIALASGWGANWLTDWISTDKEFLKQGLDLADNEFVAGYIHVGSESIVPPERPRPNMEEITSWVSN
jgi:nitroreductase